MSFFGLNPIMSGLSNADMSIIFTEKITNCPCYKMLLSALHVLLRFEHAPMLTKSVKGKTLTSSHAK